MKEVAQWFMMFALLCMSVDTYHIAKSLDIIAKNSSTAHKDSQ